MLSVSILSINVINVKEHCLTLHYCTICVDKETQEVDVVWVWDKNVPSITIPPTGPRQLLRRHWLTYKTADGRRRSPVSETPARYVPGVASGVICARWRGMIVLDRPMCLLSPQPLHFFMLPLCKLMFAFRARTADM
ncbi:hypothetical protein J6590_051670 [Homalodisca vitripennis]|nr:hypothetical protein J6590_051670 [Homalodisca vitripennis]